jgi:anaerobic selenocysteine-containing dehydrogenase
LENLLLQSGVGLSFAELAARGTVFVSPEPIIPFAEGKFPTPSGKVEISGDIYATAGLPRAPQPWADAAPKGGRLRLLSPASPWRMNSSYDNVEKVRLRAPRAEVRLHPDEAAARGFTDGTPVTLFNDAGRLSLQVACSDEVPLGVALVHKGRWPKLDPSHANVNILNAGQKSDMGESSSVHSVEVEIARAV